jgi:hypothetical protein
MSRLRTISFTVLALAVIGCLRALPATFVESDAIDEEPDAPPLKIPPGAFRGRSGETKLKLLKRYGGNEESERAVARGLAWLAKQQKKDGGWEFDQGSKDERAAATGMALLAFLGAGETHKNAKGKYTDVVKNGVGWLVKICPEKGPNAGRMSVNMYSQAIATLALCEAYGMTLDPALRQQARAAISHIQRAQGPNGSWAYAAGGNGDTSIVGWQIQALQAAKHCGDIVVDDRVITRAIKFLDLAAAGEKKSMYGYNDNAGAQPGTSLTAVGLLCRYYIDGWRADHPGMLDGVDGLVKAHLQKPAAPGEIKNMYYYYYATQVVRLSEDEVWATWNEGGKVGGKRQGGMRDVLIGAQVRKDGDDAGSWDPEIGFIGSSCGRLGTTAICLLNLEVYYRYVPAEKKDDKK